jgi:hypothetical protein
MRASWPPRNNAPGLISMAAALGLPDFKAKDEPSLVEGLADWEPIAYANQSENRARCRR